MPRHSPYALSSLTSKLIYASYYFVRFCFLRCSFTNVNSATRNFIFLLLLASISFVIGFSFNWETRLIYQFSKVIVLTYQWVFYPKSHVYQFFAKIVHVSLITFPKYILTYISLVVFSSSLKRVSSEFEFRRIRFPLKRIFSIHYLVLKVQTSKAHSYYLWALKTKQWL